MPSTLPPSSDPSPNAMPIVMVGPFPEDPQVMRGGVQASVYGLSHALVKRPDIASLKIFSLPEKKMQGPLRHEIVEGLDVTYLNALYGKQMSSIVHLPKFLPLMKKSDRRTFHIHGTGLLQTALLLCLRLKGLPFVWTLHGITEKEELQRWRERRSPGNLMRYLLYRTIERISLRVSSKIIVDTPYVKEAIQSNRRVCVIPQGIFQDEFIGSEATPRDPNLLICLGVYDPRKGHTLTLEAFARILAEIPAARLVIAGADTSNGYYERLMEKATALGIADAVEFAINRPRREIVQWLLNARLFVLHSREESQGIALCEALAASLPIVATDVGGIPFVVEDGIDGTLVSYGDVEGYAAAAIALLTDPARHESMAKAAKAASARFDWGNIAEQVATLYRAG